jgi:hypothetical protein
MPQISIFPQKYHLLFGLPEIPRFYAYVDQGGARGEDATPGSGEKTF